MAQNITCGEGGALLINKNKHLEKAELFFIRAQIGIILPLARLQNIIGEMLDLPLL